MSTSLFPESHLNADGVPEIKPEQLKEKSSDVEMIDVRRPDEYTGELGHIEGARLVCLQTDLEAHLSQLDPAKTYVFICRSGARSSTATEMAQAKGIKNSYNLMGGMIRWNALDFPVVKS